MKHRLTIPFGDDPVGIDINAWVHGCGWRVTSWTREGFGCTPRGASMTVTLEPSAYPLMTITACSGSTLVYDATEQSMGVTLLSEPQDAVPTGEWFLACPGCGRLWSELPAGHTYDMNSGCFDVPREDSVPSEPEDAVPQSFVEQYADPNLLTRRRRRKRT